MYSNLAEALLDKLSLPVLAVDNDGHILEMNEAARRLLPPAAPTASPSLEMLFPEWDVVPKLMGSHTERFREEIKWGESGVADATVTRLPGYGWAITLYDISSYKESETALNNVMGEVIHDLKQPLSAISGFVDVVKAGGEVNDRQVQFLDRIRATASRMAEQVHQLLDMTWIDSGMRLTLADVDLVNLTKITLDDLEQRAVSRHIKLVFEPPSSAPIIQGDAPRLSEVVVNLVTNAIKYSGEGTTVTVKIGVQPDALVMTVADQGIGILPEHLPNLFERFYRVQDKQTRRIEGTGLGLYIARSIVEKHGGQISVQSAPGEGSTFTISLPLPSERKV